MDCPSRPELLRFLGASLPVDQCAALEEHLQFCESCRIAMARLVLRNAAPVSSPMLLVSSATETVNYRSGRVQSPSSASVPRLVSLPDYEIHEELGRGSTGIVYRAKHKRLGFFVALKTLSIQGTEEDRRRFLMEADAVAQLRHPNIVRIYDVGRWEGRYYLALEFVSGGTLLALLSRQGALSPQSAAVLTATLARAIHASHQAGIIHCDLKPGNILLTPATAENTPRPKITDFGIARKVGVGKRLSRVGVVLGTPAYMAPEQALGRGAQIGVPVDVYGLGAMLYHMVSGEPPFQEGSAIATLKSVVELEPLAFEELGVEVDPSLEAICRRCLAKSPEKRYASAAELAAVLESWAGQ